MITVSFKQAKPLELEIDLDALSFGDALRLMQLQGNPDSEEALLEMMDIISKLVGQPAKALPLRHVQAIMEAVTEAIKAGSDTEKN